MNKKIIISLLLVGVLAFGLGLGSYAWFTSQATSTDNTFTTGRLSVNNETAFNTAQVGLVNLGNLKPGDLERFTFDVKNTGTLEMKYRFKLTGITGGLTTGDHPLEISIDNVNWAKISENYFENDSYVLALDGAASHMLYVRMPQAAGNSYQRATGSFAIVVEATQTANSGWAQ